MTVIRFPGHNLHRCDEINCYVCDGGLALCTVCGGAEGSMPTDCPGERMPDVVNEGVYNGEVDYRHGKGWVQESAWMKIIRKGY